MIAPPASQTARALVDQIARRRGLVDTQEWLELPAERWPLLILGFGTMKYHALGADAWVRRVATDVERRALDLLGAGYSWSDVIREILADYYEPGEAVAMAGLYEGYPYEEIHTQRFGSQADLLEAVAFYEARALAELSAERAPPEVVALRAKLPSTTDPDEATDIARALYARRAGASTYTATHLPEPDMPINTLARSSDVLRGTSAGQALAGFRPAFQGYTQAADAPGSGGLGASTAAASMGSPVTMDVAKGAGIGAVVGGLLGYLLSGSAGGAVVGAGLAGVAGGGVGYALAK